MGLSWEILQLGAYIGNDWKKCQLPDIKKVRHGPPLGDEPTLFAGRSRPETA